MGAMTNTGLCQCGSGLKAVRCCALDKAAMPAPEASALLDAEGENAVKLFNEKKHAEAEALALKILDLAPLQRAALRVMFELRKAQNRAPAAEALARRLAEQPGPPAAVGPAQSQLAQYIISQGRHADARPAAEAALIAQPRDPTAHHILGVVLTETSHLREGERHYRRAMSLLGRDDGLILGNLAWNLKLQGRLSESAAFYQTALALRPDNRRGTGGFAQVHLGRRDFAAAASVLDTALAAWPDDRTLRLLRALVDLNAGNADAVLTRLNDAPEAMMSAELAARGQAFARLERPVEAVGQFALAKRMQRERQQQSYDHSGAVAKAEAYKAFFTADRLLPLPRAAAGAIIQPVFLLGFPRSGTALLEQLLAQVPGFAPGDELFPLADLLPLIPRLTGSSAAYPEALAQALVGEGQDLPGELRARYIAARAHAGLFRPGITFFTDRNASNAWHLPLIKMLFPDAPVIHLLRHPRDVALSNFSQDRKLEANCNVSLPAIATHYALVMSMIRHYRANLTLRYLPVRYEDLVQNPAATLAEVLAFIGANPASAPPESDLLSNHAPLTGPVPGHYAQAEPVHLRGLFRHHLYQAAMPALFHEIDPVLAPWVKELGYGADA